MSAPEVIRILAEYREDVARLTEEACRRLQPYLDEPPDRVLMADAQAHLFGEPPSWTPQGSQGAATLVDLDARRPRHGPAA